MRFAAAISAINCRRSAGNGGRPRGTDFQRQNNWKPLRCHRMSVSGFTTVRSRRQSMSRDSTTSVIRVASSARRGFTCRSRYNANCFRRNRFSATSCAYGRHVDATNRRTSPATRRIVQTTTWERDWAMPQDGTPRTLPAVDPLYIDVQHDRFRPLSSIRSKIFPGSNFCGPHPSTCPSMSEARSAKIAHQSGRFSQLAHQSAWMPANPSIRPPILVLS